MAAADATTPTTPAAATPAQEIASTATYATRLTAGLAAVGTAVLSSIQLAKLGELSGVRLGVAVVATFAALVCVLAGVLLTVRVMLPHRFSLHELLRAEPEPVPDGFYSPQMEAILSRHGYQEVAKLAAHYDTALELRHRALGRYYEKPDADTRRQAEDTSKMVAELNATIVALLETSQLEDTAAAFRRATRRLPLLAIGLLVALAAAVWATNPPDPEPLDLRGANLTGVHLSDAELRGVVLDGMKIQHADLRGTYLGDSSIDHTTWVDVTCPDGVDSDNAGRTCAGHLEP